MFGIGKSIREGMCALAGYTHGRLGRQYPVKFGFPGDSFFYRTGTLDYGRIVHHDP